MNKKTHIPFPRPCVQSEVPEIRFRTFGIDGVGVLFFLHFMIVMIRRGGSRDRCVNNEIDEVGKGGRDDENLFLTFRRDGQSRWKAHAETFSFPT